MYAIVKTGGKQYKVAPGDKLNIEKLDAEVGAKVELDAICVVDGKKVEADPAKAAATKVVAVVLEQFKGEKQLVFKFKKRKNYKKLRGHRQQLTRVEIESIGSAKAAKPAAKKAAKKAAPKKVEKADDEAKAEETKVEAEEAAVEAADQAEEAAAENAEAVEAEAVEKEKAE